MSNIKNREQLYEYAYTKIMEELDKQIDELVDKYDNKVCAEIYKNVNVCLYKEKQDPILIPEELKNIDKEITLDEIEEKVGKINKQKEQIKSVIESLKNDKTEKYLVLVKYLSNPEKQTITKTYIDSNNEKKVGTYDGLIPFNNYEDAEKVYSSTSLPTLAGISICKRREDGTYTELKLS